MSLTLTSPAFADGAAIPDKYTRQGENLSPPLKWSGVPEGTRSLVLAVEDPDAPSGTFRHFAAYNIPADRTELPQSVDTGPDRAISFARNDFGSEAYDGPEPPVGHGVHRYYSGSRRSTSPGSPCRPMPAWRRCGRKRKST